MPPSLITTKSFKFSLAVLACSSPDLHFWEMPQSLWTLQALPSAVTVAQLHNCCILIREHQTILIFSLSVCQILILSCCLCYGKQKTTTPQTSSRMCWEHKGRELSNTTLNSSMYLKMSPFQCGCCYCEGEKGKMTFVRRWEGTAYDINEVAEEWHYQILMQLSYEKKLQILVSIQKNLSFRASLGWIVKTKANC